jgi:outer membrane protein TolC
MKKGLLVVLGLVSFSITTYAQVRFHSLQEVLNFADTHAIGIQNSRKQEDLLALKIKESKTNRLPTFSANIGYNDNITLQPLLIPAQVLNPSAPEGNFTEVTAGTKYNYYFSSKIQWDVLNFQKQFAVKTAEAEWRKGKLNTALNKLNIYNVLANTYYSILLTKEAIEIYKENLSVTQSIYNSAQNKFNKGIISEGDLNLAEIKKIQSESILQNAESNLNQLMVQFQSQLNIKDAIEIDDQLDTFLIDESLISSTHPEVLLKEAEITKQESILKQTKALRLPMFSLSYQNARSWAGQEFFNFSDVNNLSNQVFGANISIPIGNFSTKQKIKQSELELDIKKMDLENTKLVKDKEDELLNLRLNQAEEQLRQKENILRLQNSSDKHAENKYQKEIISLDERLNHYEDLLSSQDAYLQTLGTLTIAKYQLYIRALNYQ